MRPRAIARTLGGGMTRRSTERERMLADLPVTERRLGVAGTETAILEGGVGPPLILLHGGIECGGAYWAPVIPALAGRHRLIAPDVPGLGESSPLRRLDTEAFAAWFAGLIDKTCDERPVLIAHSLLGSLAASFAGARPDVLRQLCIYAAPGVGPYRMPFRLRVVAVRFALRTDQRNAERFERFALLDRERTRSLAEDWFDSFSSYTLAQAQVRHVKRTMNQLIRVGTRRTDDADLRRINAPVSLIWGMQDRMVPIELAYGARSRLGWPLRVVDGAAHAPHIERPGAFVARLEEALGTSFAPPPTKEVLG
jgi:pimeloyl-ACP methyl ester carboxylesterase